MIKEETAGLLFLRAKKVTGGGSVTRVSWEVSSGDFELHSSDEILTALLAGRVSRELVSVEEAEETDLELFLFMASSSAMVGNFCFFVAVVSDSLSPLDLLSRFLTVSSSSRITECGG